MKMLFLTLAVSIIYGSLAVYANTSDVLPLNSAPVVATPVTAVRINMGVYTYVVTIREDGNLWAVAIPFLQDPQAEVPTFMLKENVVSITVSYSDWSNDYLGHLYAITTDGTLWRWGNDRRYYVTVGLLPITGETTQFLHYTGTGITLREPPIAFKQNVAFVVGGTRHSHAITTDGRLWAWGGNNRGQLGDGTTQTRPYPVPIMDNVVQAGTGRSRAWAVTASGYFYVWGDSTMYLTTPTRAMQGVRYAAQSQDSIATTFIIMDDGKLWGIGELTYRVGLSDGFGGPIFVPIMEDVDTIWAGYGVALATTKDGTVWVWGTIPPFTNTITPMPYDVVASLDSRIVFALTSTGEIIRFTYGQLSQPYTVNYVSAATEIPDPAVTRNILRFVIGEATFTDNGTTRNLDAPTFIADGRTMIPLRVIVEAFGATDLSFAAGVVSFILNGETITMTIDQPLPGNLGTPIIVEGRTFVPLLYIIQEMGATTRWDGYARAVYIYV